MIAHVPEPLAPQMVALLGRQKYTSIETTPCGADRPGLVRITASYDEKAKGSGRCPASFKAKDLEAAHAYVDKATAKRRAELLAMLTLRPVQDALDHADHAAWVAEALRSAPGTFEEYQKEAQEAGTAALEETRQTLPRPIVEPEPDPEPEAEEVPTVLVPEEVRKAIGLASHAVLTNGTRRNLSGVHVSVKLGTLYVQATDGHRLFAWDTLAAGHSDFETLLPLDVARSIAKGKGPLGLPLYQDFGKFPNIAPVIPDASTPAITVKVADLIPVLNAIAKMSAEKIKPIRMTVQPGGLCFESERAEYGDSEATCPAQVPKGYTGAIGFNTPFLLDVCRAVKAAGGKVLRLQVTDPLKPMRWTCPELPCAVGVLMPLRLEWGRDEQPSMAPEAPARVEQFQPVVVAQTPAPVSSEPHGGAVSAPGTATIYLLPAPNATEAPAPATTTQPATLEHATMSATLHIEQYSPKGLVIHGAGEVGPLAERIKAAVPKASTYHCPRRKGWIFSVKHITKLREALTDLLQAPQHAA